MDFLAAIHPGFVASGFLVGTLVGLTGVGGGSLLTPILILLFGIPPVAAVGTDLLHASASKTIGAFVHGAHDTIDWRVVRRLASGSVPTATVTLLALNSLGISSDDTNALVSVVLAVTLLITSAALFFRKHLLTVYVNRVGTLDEGRTRWLTILTGVVLGALVASTSVGAGALGVTALILLYPKLPAARLVGSDIAHAVPLTLVAGAGHWLLGNTNFILAGTLLLGSIPGILLGSALASRVPELLLRRVMAVVLLGVALRLLL